MSDSEFASLSVTINPLNESTLNKGIFICLLHAKRVPPHIGIIMNGQFHSLTIKGSEPGVPLKALLRTIANKKIETLILKIVPHPIYSLDYLNEIFLEILKTYPVINSDATCLSPLKAFFNEYYALESTNEDIIFSFLNRLNNNNFILEAYSLNLTLRNNSIEIPIYTQSELKDKIKAVRADYYNN